MANEEHLEILKQGVEICYTRHIGDFSRWKDHDTYQKAFERLLRDLKAQDSEDK
jgi:hypothetical protein